MGLLTQTQQQYYAGAKSFTGDGTTTIFKVSMTQSAFPSWFDASNATVYIDNALFAQATTPALGSTTTSTVNYTFSFDTSVPNGWHIEFATAPADGVIIVVDVSTDFGNYQYITIRDIIKNFMVAYVGEEKIITKIKRTDVAFHAQRALQELSYDTLRSLKTQEIEVPASLKMILPQDYVGYVKLTWMDSSGIEHVLYPARKTSNPTAIKQDSDGNYDFDIDDDGTEDTTLLINPNDSDTWESYKSATPSENQDDYQDDIYWPIGGERYGLDPQHAQVNGSYFIDNLRGYIYFSSNMSGKTVTLKYIGDGLGQTVGCTTYNPGDIAENVRSGEVPVDSGGANSCNWVSGGPSTGQSDQGALGSSIITGEGTSITNPNLFFVQSVTLGTGDVIKMPSGNIWKMVAPGGPNSCTWGCYDPESVIGAKSGHWQQCDSVVGSAGEPRANDRLTTVCSVEDAVVHKFAEEAMYKWIAYAILATRTNIPEYLVARFKRERFTTTRTAKLRLSNIKIEEIAQIMRGKSKQIKH